MWIVQLRQEFTYPYEEVRTSVICGCDTEEAAHAAGKLAVSYYNNWPLALSAGCVSLSMALIHEPFTYAVKYQEGERI